MAGSRIAPAPRPARGAESRPAAADGPAGPQLQRPEVRDVLAWMRLLVDPHDAAAVVRALARPPIELRQVELARVIQVARRRTSSGGTHGGGHAGKLGLVLGLVAATESPQVPPEVRERIQRFLRLHAAVSAHFHADPPDVFLARLIQALRAGGRPSLLARDTRRQDDGLEQLQRLARELIAREPRASAHDLARHLAVVVPGAGARLAPADTSAEPDRELHAALALLREEVLDGVARIGGRLSELRLDTDLDISHGIVRYLELLKVSALLQRPPGQELEDALADVNARLLAAVTPLQREILLTSTLDPALLAREERIEGEHGERDALARQHARAHALAPREQHSLTPFLPRKGVGLALSASDIHTYRACPLRYKYARVLRIPVEQTVHQRFGIVVHQVLERYHADGADTLERMLSLLDACWRRGGLGQGEHERQLRHKAVDALTRYHARLHARESRPVWFERSFAFRIGPHHLRGRVDRVDRVGEEGCEASAAGGGGAGLAESAAGGQEAYELIDYKTSRPKSAQELSRDLQLSLYALAAQEDWGLECSRQAYYYVLDDLIVPVAVAQRDAQAVKDVVLEVGEGILGEEFQPTPSAGACAMCDYRIVCPAAAA
ncbi:MAG TPA: PD-(D/E)XK nuclease family protein [Solirubrobacteraceae bacterium]|nr:PD-(D/E)XK nuclease family protein [Solirubrobacteraceae bacterium]